MTIKLKSGRVVEDRTYIGIDEDGEVSQPYDTTTSIGSVFRGDDPEEDITAADLTPEERMELALVMVLRWSHWAGFPVEHMALAIEDEEHAQALAAAKKRGK